MAILIQNEKLARANPDSRNIDRRNPSIDGQVYTVFLTWSFRSTFEVRSRLPRGFEGLCDKAVTGDRETKL
jgi:hypothetical protein